MEIVTPEQLVAFFNDEEARVNDEVMRIRALLCEREPATSQPRNKKGNIFWLRLPDNYDGAFMEKVAAKFRTAGWKATFEYEQDITGSYCALVLGSPALSALPPEQVGFAGTNLWNWPVPS